MTCFRLDNGETVLHWCKQNNIPYNNVYRRIEDGMSIKEALEDVSKRLKKGEVNRKHFYKGKWIGEYFPRGSGMYERVIYRIKKGMTVDKAMEKVISMSLEGGDE